MPTTLGCWEFVSDTRILRQGGQSVRLSSVSRGRHSFHLLAINAHGDSKQTPTRQQGITADLFSCQHLGYYSGASSSKLFPAMFRIESRSHLLVSDGCFAYDASSATARRREKTGSIDTQARPEGVDAAEGKPGKLWIRGPTMKRTPDGWFMTGDVSR
ncbi:hypothetical protein IW262DRAFT_220636 [Armillaria fumosa]|nr:hypothetical protein IW262DRAFT_220636 [Armillaria fumosa]